MNLEKKSENLFSDDLELWFKSFKRVILFKVF
jgi:hypothetical protein